MNLIHQKYIASILRWNEFSITNITSIEDLGTFEYSNENIVLLSEITRSGKYDELKKLAMAKDLLGEDLTLIEFSDQNGRKFRGLVYDSIELWNDPYFLEIISVDGQ
jgi:hypothetical protein